MLFSVLKIVLTIFVCFVFYFQVKSIDFSDVEATFQFRVIPGLFLIFLMPLNYYFEWQKWKSITETINVDLGIKTNFQAFMAGIITGMLTPNMQGNFLGRMYYFPRRYRISIVLLTIWSNLSQFIIALVFGLISIFLVQAEYFPEIEYTRWILLLLVFILLLLFFTFERWQFGFEKIKWLRRIRQHLKENFRFRLEQLGWGTLRYFVFSVQFTLAFMTFGATFSWELFLTVFQIYLWTTLAPSLILGKLVVRESIAIWVMSSLGLDIWTIISASLYIWIVNLLIPTLFGIVICKEKTIEV